MLHAKSQQSKIWIGMAAAALGSFALIGCGGGDPAPTTTTDAGSGGNAGGPKMGAGGGGGAAGGGGGQQAAQAPTGPPKDKVAGAPGARQDPFKPWFNTIPPPPPVTSFLEPARIALSGTTAPEVQPGVEIQEVPNRRVAGILTGNGVYALLEDGKVVKPGDLTDDGYQVVMINSNSVTLRKKVLSQTYTQVVPLTDAGSSYAAAPQMNNGGFNRAPGRGGPGFGGPGGGGPSRSGGSSAGGAATGSGN